MGIGGKIAASGAVLLISCCFAGAVSVGVKSELLAYTNAAGAGIGALLIVVGAIISIWS